MQHWIFDLDGTLVDTLPAYQEKLRRIFSHFDLPCTEDDFRIAMNYFDAREFFALYLEERHIGEACDLLSTLSLEFACLAKPFEGVTDLLSHLRDQGREINLWTGRDLASAKKILRHTGLDQYFTSCISGTCVVRKKPHPEGLLKILEITIHGNDQTIMVGDHHYDIEGAKAAGVGALSVSWGHQGPHPLESVSDAHFYEVSELLHWARSQRLRAEKAK